MISDGAYPYRAGIGGTWSHRIIRGLPEHTFDLITVGEQRYPAAFVPPTNATAWPAIALTPAADPGRRSRDVRNRRRRGTHAAVLLCRSMLADTPHSLAMFRSSLTQLTSVAAGGQDPLRDVPLDAVLLDAWCAAGGPAGGGLPCPALPQPTRADTDETAELVRRAIRALVAPVVAADLNHATDACLGALVAIGAKWRSGVPYVLTEHDTYLTGEPSAMSTSQPAVRAVVMRFRRAVARLAYQEAYSVAAPTEPLLRWALDHGADPATARVVGYGVDPHSCLPLRGEPAEPRIAFLGPDHDVGTMLRALGSLRADRPGVRVIVGGPPVAGRAVDVGTVSFLGPVNHRRSAYAIGQIVVVSGRHPAAPYALIEAMMCGRPTICLDDGPLTAIAGSAVTVVPHDDPARLAGACAALLDAPDRRRIQSVAASQRARSLFALRTTIDAVDEIYRQIDVYRQIDPEVNRHDGTDDTSEPAARTEHSTLRDLIRQGTSSTRYRAESRHVTGAPRRSWAGITAPGRAPDATVAAAGRWGTRTTTGS
jgi:glycosyltransferase involved in cell wall biosynthesis